MELSRIPALHTIPAEALATSFPSSFSIVAKLKDKNRKIMFQLSGQTVLCSQLTSEIDQEVKIGAVGKHGR